MYNTGSSYVCSIYVGSYDSGKAVRISRTSQLLDADGWNHFCQAGQTDKESSDVDI